MQSDTQVMRDKSRLGNMAGETRMEENWFLLLVLISSSFHPALLALHYCGNYKKLSQIIIGNGWAAGSTSVTSLSSKKSSWTAAREIRHLHQSPINPADKEAFAVRRCRTGPKPPSLETCSQFMVLLQKTWVILCYFLFGTFGKATTTVVFIPGMITLFFAESCCGNIQSSSVCSQLDYWRSLDQRITHSERQS